MLIYAFAFNVWFCLDYIIGLVLYGYLDVGKLIYTGDDPLKLAAVVFAAVGALYTLNKICEWYIHNWATHPIAQNLSVYSNNNRTWMDVAADINREYQRFI